jgi:hypothetical protein
MARPRGLKLWLLLAAGGLLFLLVAAGLIWRDDILEALLDPKVPYAVYKPPPAPDYTSRSAWALAPGPLRAGDPPVDVFFVHPTTFDGGRDWNGPINDRGSARILARVMLPNYAAPFALGGRVFAPLYRQASLYTSLTLFDDAIEARQFAYGDVAAAFRAFLARAGPGRPFIVVGVEQGGELADRLLREVIEPDAVLKGRLAAAYLIGATVLASDYDSEASIPACSSPDQAGCVVAWVAAQRMNFMRAQRILHRSLVWNGAGRLVPLAGRPILCVNPLLGKVSDEDAPARLNRGAASAAGLEWGVRPAFLVRQVAAQCEDGILRVTNPRSASLRPSGDWAGRLKAPAYNLFWGDLEADAQRRTRSWLARPHLVTPLR